MTNLRRLLAHNMKEKRHFFGLSQAKLAEKVGTATTYIAMIELEKRFPSVEMLERIAFALNIDSPDLFSKTSFQTKSLEKLQESVLQDIESLIQSKIVELQTTTEENTVKICSDNILSDRA